MTPTLIAQFTLRSLGEVGLLAQLPPATAPEIGAWLGTAAAVMAIYYLGLRIYSHHNPRPPQTQPIGPQPLQVQQAHEFATKPELGQLKTHVDGEVHQLHGRISSVRNEVNAKVDAIDERIDAIPQRTIELLKTVKEYHKS